MIYTWMFQEISKGQKSLYVVWNNSTYEQNPVTNRLPCYLFHNSIRRW